MSDFNQKYCDLVIKDLQSANVHLIIREIKEKIKPASIRLWKLGSLDHKVMPTKESFEHLRKILENWDGVSTIDIIWGPDLKLEVFEINADKNHNSVKELLEVLEKDPDNKDKGSHTILFEELYKRIRTLEDKISSPYLKKYY
jgi:hypothetical protein